MPKTLPKGWLKTTLGEIAEPWRDRSMPRDVISVSYVGLEHIEPETMRLLGHSDSVGARSSSVRFSKGDVLYSKMRPYLNKVWVAEFDGLCSSEFLVFPKSDHLNSQFLAFRLNSRDFVAFANRQTSGERPRVDFKKLSAFPILLPPTAEQNRIVAKLNAALPRMERAYTAAFRARQRLPEYRATVLRAALTGELTREWREAQKKKKGRQPETGQQVLNRILTIRRQRWEQSEITHRIEKGKEPKGQSWKEGYEKPELPTTLNLPELPAEWTWASMDMIADIHSGISVSQNRIVSNPIELPYLRVANVMRGYLDLSEVKTIRVERDVVDNYLLEQGDILFNEGGDRDKLGRGWIWEGQILKCTHQNHVFRARLFDRSIVDPRLISHWGNTFGQSFFLRHAKQTTNLASINQSVLRRLPVPIPPRAEQLRIMQEIERRLLAAERLAIKLDRQSELSSSARQALLLEAFEGELVPQHPNDEPASAVLAGIRAERIEREAERKQVRRLRPSQTRKDHMQGQLPSIESINVAWNNIGRKPDARRLFVEAGFGPEHVVQFYEALRGTPEVRDAFRDAAPGRRHPRSLVAVDEESPSEPKGSFRLDQLWLEDFKNLKDYSVQFDPAHGLDVVLGWNGTGKSNLFEALVIIFRDLHNWWEKNRWPDKPMNGFRLRFEMDDNTVEVNWQPGVMKRPELRKGPMAHKLGEKVELEPIKREELPLPRFVFGYYSGPTNRLAEHFLPMKQAHYDRLRKAKADDAKTLAKLLEQRRFFCAETRHAKFVLLAFSYKEDVKINDFLEKRLRISGFESALFVIRKPRWARSNKAEDFWGATGIMRRVMERLRRYAIAPMVLKQTVSYGYRSVTEDLYYFFLPDLKSLHSFAAEYPDARTFFLALESTDFSELIHDVKIQVRVKSTETEQVSITFHQLSEGEQQLLMVLGLMRFTKSHQSLVLLDEPDTHLNPHWSVHYLKDLTQVMSDTVLQSPEQQSSQTLMATHDPLVIASLVKEQVHLLKRDLKTGACKWFPASVNPRGLGFTGILTSEMFGFRSDLDPETLADLDNRVRLIGKDEALTNREKKELEKIDQRLAEAGFSKAFSDPYYAAFVRAWGRRHSELMAGEEFLTPEKRQEIETIAQEVLEEAVAEVERGVVG